MPTRHSGFFVQREQVLGMRGDFVMVLPAPSFGGCICCRRDNKIEPAVRWEDISFFGDGLVSAVSLIESSYAAPRGSIPVPPIVSRGYLEVIARVGNHLEHYWELQRDPDVWRRTSLPISGVAGNPALIQSTFGRPGNLELVVPRVDGGLAHYWCDTRGRNEPGGVWSAAEVFGESIGRVDAVALIQSHYGSPGNLEVVVRVGDRLMHGWRDANGWHGPVAMRIEEPGLPATPIGVPGFVLYRGFNNFEVVTALSNGQMVHLYRDNYGATGNWRKSAEFGSASLRYTTASLVQGDFGPQGNLEVVTVDGLGRVKHFWRNDPPYTWREGVFVLERHP